MAVGDYVLNRKKPQPPLELIKALNYEKWGIGDVMQLPAGLLPRLNTCLSYYYALQEYNRSAGKTASMARNNPDAWRLVSNVIEWRLERN